VLLVVIVVAGMGVIAVLVGVAGFAGEDSLDAMEIAAGEREETASQQHVHDVHVRCVVGAQAEQVFDEFKHGRVILGGLADKARAA
jgi:hypothetical protein